MDKTIVVLVCAVVTVMCASSVMGGWAGNDRFGTDRFGYSNRHGNYPGGQSNRHGNYPGGQYGGPGGNYGYESQGSYSKGYEGYGSYDSGRSNGYGGPSYGSYGGPSYGSYGLNGAANNGYDYGTSGHRGGFGSNRIGY